MPSTAPVVPPRPSRSPRPNPSNPSSDVPKVPPRPSNRRLERSTSPGQGSLAPSPLNETRSSVRVQSQNESSSDLSSSSPSVTVPSLGQGGMEHEGINPGTALDSENQLQEPPDEQVRDIGSDVKLHAPKPSLPSSTARANVHAVANTNSQQAAAAGFGKAVSPGHGQTESDSHPLPSEGNGSRAGDTAPRDEPQASTVLENEQRTPDIGQQVPTNPDAGDVQAPSASPPVPASREDEFEKDNSGEHSDELACEEQERYGPGLATERAESSLNSDDSNKLVKDSTGGGAGHGTTSPTDTGTPEEQRWYITSEEFTSRLTSSNPTSHNFENSQSMDSQASIDSPHLRTDEPSAREDEHLKESVDVPDEDAFARDKEDGIHIDEPCNRQHRPGGFAPAPEHQSDGDTHFNPWQDDTNRSKESSVSTLASDGMDHDPEQESGDIQTPLEDVSPTRSPEDGSRDKENELLSTDRFKQCPENMDHRHPSHDTWEKSPDNLQLQKVVSATDVPDHRGVEDSGNAYVSPSYETQKEDTAELGSQNQELKSGLEREAVDRLDMGQRLSSADVWEDALESHQHATTVQAPEPETKVPIETIPPKPAIPPRPNVHKAGEQLQSTTVPPPIPSRPQKRVLKAPPFDSQATPAAQSNLTSTSPAAVSPTESRKAPVLPDRPKPQIPARPPRPAARGSAESLTRVNSGVSTENGETSKSAPAPPPKPKPAVPAKPGGSKIAALKAGLLSDLDKRLLAGPMAAKPPEKKEEPEAPAEKGPLSDARKGRARGPARRKPAVATLPKAEAPSTEPSAPEIKITGSWNVWQVNEDGTVVVGDEKSIEKMSTPESERSSSQGSSIKSTTEDAIEPTSLEAAQVKASPTKESPVDTTLPDTTVPDEANKPPSDETPKADEPEPSTTPSVETSTQAIQVKASPTKEAPVDNLLPDNEENKPLTDETPKSDEPVPSTTPIVETSTPPNDATNDLDKDETKGVDEERQFEVEPDDTAEPEKEMPSVPVQYKEGEDKEEEGEEDTKTDEEPARRPPSLSGNEKSHADETLLKSDG